MKNESWSLMKSTIIGRVRKKRKFHAGFQDRGKKEFSYIICSLYNYSQLWSFFLERFHSEFVIFDPKWLKYEFLSSKSVKIVELDRFVPEYRANFEVAICEFWWKQHSYTSWRPSNFLDTILTKNDQFS